MNPSPLLTQTLAASSLIVLSVITIILATSTLPTGFRKVSIGLYACQAAVGSAFYAALPLAHDAAAYHAQASAQAAYWSGELANPPDLYLGKAGFPILMGAIYFLVGDAPYLGILLNSLLLALCAPLVGKTALLLDATPRNALRATCFLFAPNFLLWGGSFLREASAWLGASMVICATVALGVRAKALPYTALLVTGALISYSVRSSTGMIMVSAALLALLLTSRASLAMRTVIAMGALAAAPIALTFASRAQLGDQASLQMSRNELASSGSGFTSGVGSLPVGILRVALGPLPWEWGGISSLYLVDYVVWIAVVIGVARRLRLRREVTFILAPALGYAISLGIASGNYGTMVRLRSTLALMLLPLLANSLRRASAKVLAPPRRSRHSRRATAHLNTVM